MVPQPYSVLTGDAHVMLHNSVTMVCTLPSHVTEFVSVLAWRVEERGRAPLSLKHQHRYGSLVWSVLSLHARVAVRVSEC